MREYCFIEIPNPKKGNGIRYGEAALQLLNEGIESFYALDVAQWKEYGHNVKDSASRPYATLADAWLERTYRATLILVKGKPIGIAMTLRNQSYVAFWNFVITAEYRRQGYGKLLMQHCIEENRKRGFTEFSLTVHGANDVAAAMYKAAGFVVKSTTMSLKLQGEAS